MELKNKRKIGSMMAVLSAFALILISVAVIIEEKLVNSKAGVNAFIYLFVLLFSLILYIGCMLCEEEDKKKKRLFMLMICLSFLSAFFGMAVVIFNGNSTMRLMTVTCQILNNSLLSVFWLVFWYYQKGNYKRFDTEMIFDWVISVYMLIYTAFSLLNFFVPVLFVVPASGSIVYRTDYFTLSYLSLWYVFYVGYVFSRKCDLRTKFTLSSYVLFPMFLNCFAFFLPETSEIRNLYYSLTSLCFLIPLYLIYFNLHIENTRKLEKQKEELTQTRIHLMISQIQPHFIYNSLTAIIDLIDKDKEQAKESIVSFSDYLRVNLDSLKEVKLIPFEKELEHLKTYLAFEQMRFDNIEVVYELKVKDFLLPALTVQPIVENAVKHGVSKTGVGGKITVSSFEDEEAIVISVEDNGVGFETDEKSSSTHIGLYNVEKRLYDMCDGRLEIESEKGIGTRVNIILKKDMEP